MTLEQLRVFVTVAELEHVTRAAQALNLAQSAASNAIAALEARHDTKLFDRVGRGIHLTDAGRALLTEARAVLARASAAELILAEFGSLQRGTLTVAASQTIADYWLPRHLAAFRRAYPQVTIRVAIDNTARVAAAVEGQTAELGFVESSVAGEQLLSTVVARDQLVIVVCPDHPWAARASLTPADLVEADWVLRERGSGTRAVFEAALAQFGIDPAALRVQLELASNEAVRGVVEAGLGATVISASVAAPSLEAGLLSEVNLRLPTREFHVLCHRERYRSRAAAAFLAMLMPSGKEPATAKARIGHQLRTSDRRSVI
jgi:DNA-binding transcriptional LysR family regulator